MGRYVALGEVTLTLLRTSRSANMIVYAPTPTPTPNAYLAQCVDDGAQLHAIVRGLLGHLGLGVGVRVRS